MPRRISVEIVGDSGSLERSFRRSSRAARGFNRDLDRSFRGAIAGSGAFQSLGRSVAFASTAFLGGVGITAAIRSSLEAAQDQIKTNKALSAQFRAAGKDVRDYQKSIDDATSSFVSLGIQDDETIKAFTVLFRATGNVTESIDRLQLVADIAAARHVDLQKAALLVGKVETGNTGILRRYGVQVGKTATVQEALTAATQAFAGQAKAAVTPQARFAAVLDQTQETIGNALLPILTKYLERFTKWLDKTNKSGELQRRLNKLMESLGRILPRVEHGIGLVVDAVESVKDAFGGWENSIKFLLTGLLISKTAKFAGALLDAAKNAERLARAGGAAFGLPGRKVPKEAPRGGGKVPFVFPPLGPLAIAIGGVLLSAGDTRQRTGGAFSDTSGATPTLTKLLRSFGDVTEAQARIILAYKRQQITAEQANRALALMAVSGSKVADRFKSITDVESLRSGRRFAEAATADGGRAAATTPKRKDFKLTIPLQIAQAQAALTETTKDDVRVARQIVAFINKLRAARRLAPKALIDALGVLRGALGVISDADKDAASKTADAAEKQAEATKKHADAVKRAAEKQKEAAAAAAAKIREATENARTLIGDLFQGPVLAPTEQQRKAQLGVPGVDIGRLTADVTAQTSQFLEFMKSLATIRKRGGSKQLVADLRRQGLESAPVAATIAGAKPADFKKLLGALKVRERAIKKAATQPLRVFVTVNLNGKPIAADVKATLQKDARHQGRQRRGRNGGQALGLA